MTFTIEAHHGSPGTPNDFNDLKTQALNEGLNLDIKAVSRGQDASAEIIMGYSYGCVKALKKANNSKKCKALILIAPYLVNENGSNTLIKTILKTPFLGKKILSAKADSAIEELLAKSSSPQEVPPSYRELFKDIDQVSVLKNAVLEKIETEKEITDEIEKFHDSGRPLLLIAGDSDKSSPAEFHLRPFEAIENVEAHIIKDGGHALSWTHKEQVLGHIERFIKNLGAVQ